MSHTTRTDDLIEATDQYPLEERLDENFDPCGDPCGDPRDHQHEQQEQRAIE